MSGGGKKANPCAVCESVGGDKRITSRDSFRIRSGYRSSVLIVSIKSCFNRGRIETGKWILFGTFLFLLLFTLLLQALGWLFLLVLL